MENIKVKKADLLVILEQNLKGHAALFEKALEGWRKEAIAKLDELRAKVKGGDRAYLTINLPPPEDHTKDYKRVIGMLEMSIDDTIELGEHEYQQYVQDDWQWKQAWVASTARYTET